MIQKSVQIGNDEFITSYGYNYTKITIRIVEMTNSFLEIHCVRNVFIVVNVTVFKFY